MTAINHWQAVGRTGGGVTEAWLQCDGCLPPRSFVGVQDRARELGWQFDEFVSGSHRCPRCRHAEPPRVTASRPALPTFLVIGASKAGTTSLDSYLRLHPEIGMASAKELNFFHRSDAAERIELYESYFEANHAIRGEVSPQYTYEPLVPGVAERIHRVLPSVRLLFIARDPVERAISHYFEHVARDLADPDIARGFGDPDDRFNLYTAPSRYGTQLDAYLQRFPRSQLLVVDQADLRDRRRQTLQSIFEFLGADPALWHAGFEVSHNRAGDKKMVSPLGRQLLGSRVGAVSRRLPAPFYRGLLRLGKRAFVKPPPLASVPGELRDRLRRSLAPEVVRFEAIAGFRPSGWPE